MNREFLDLFERELKFFYAHAEEFAAEYPGIAQRLGGILRERTDPMVAGLLEGAAFLAARVQLKLKDEFPEFINNLLEQLVPHYLAPTPSCMIVKVKPPYGDPGLRNGRTIARGSSLDASYTKQHHRVACRYKLTAPITLLPLELVGAEYYQSVAPMQALGVPVARDAVAGMRLTLRCRMAAQPGDEPSEAESRNKTDCWFSSTRLRHLPIYLIGPEAHADASCANNFSPIPAESGFATSTSSAIRKSFRPRLIASRKSAWTRPIRSYRTTIGFFPASIFCAIILPFRADSSPSIL